MQVCYTRLANRTTNRNVPTTRGANIDTRLTRLPRVCAVRFGETCSWPYCAVTRSLDGRSESAQNDPVSLVIVASGLPLLAGGMVAAIFATRQWIGRGSASIQEEA